VRERSAWSEQQLDALAAIECWLGARDQPFFYLAGYAGTGKTTLAAEIGRRYAGDVVFGAYTGKAAAVMESKGCGGARTIDSLVYRPKVEHACVQRPPCANPPCGKLCRHARERHAGRELNKDSLVRYVGLAIIDEVSMVGEEMGRDLLSFNTPVLVLGDVAQLPPIYGGGYFTDGEPDFALTRVHRQALGSPVIELATMARRGEAPDFGDYGEGSAVVEGTTIKALLDFDQVICDTHKTRHSLNKDIRRALGYDGPTPEVGEKVICLRNNWIKDLRNGTLWTVVAAEPPDNNGFVAMTVENDDGLTVDVAAPEAGFSSYDSAGGDLMGDPFAFGYAITCHKAQGSQWDSVLVIDESWVFRRERWRWLYTAIYRSSAGLSQCHTYRERRAASASDQTGLASAYGSIRR
jgi:exodeoxyribonuclease-5